MLIRNQERRHGAATGELAGGREVEGDDLQHLQLCLRPEGEGWGGGCQVKKSAVFFLKLKTLYCFGLLKDAIAY